MTFYLLYTFIEMKPERLKGALLEYTLDLDESELLHFFLSHSPEGELENRLEKSGRDTGLEGCGR